MINWNNVLEGITIEKAKTIAKNNNKYIAIVEDDGINYWGTNDCRDDRINVKTKKGIIVEVVGIG